MDKAIISLDNIGLIKQEKRILDNVSMQISSGQKINIYGGNGVGKTSLLKIISGITSYYSGTMQIKNSVNMYEDLFYIGHKYGLKQELTVRENIEFILNFNGKHNSLNGLSDELEYYGLENTIDSKIKFLSHGQKKIVSLIQLSLLSIKIWILDEPFTGLDRKTIDRFHERIDRHINTDGIVISTSHSPKDNFINIELL